MRNPLVSPWDVHLPNADHRLLGVRRVILATLLECENPLFIDIFYTDVHQFQGFTAVLQ